MGIFQKLLAVGLPISAPSVSTGNVALKWKKITGNLDSGGTATPAHGRGGK